MDAGFKLLIITGESVLPIPTVSLGYRYQDLLKKGLVLRAGLDLGIMPYLGFGYAF